MEKPKSAPAGFTFDCVIDNIRPEADGHTYVTLKTHAKANEDLFLLIGTPLNCTVKKQKMGRTVTANSYCWELCKQIAEKISSGSLDVYRKAIRECGAYIDYTVPTDKVEEMKKVWQGFGIGWFTDVVDFSGDDESIIVRCYYGTSVYDSLQMSVLIKYLEDEADNLGITVLSARKRNEILKDWRPANTENDGENGDVQK